MSRYLEEGLSDLRSTCGIVWIGLAFLGGSYSDLSGRLMEGSLLRLMDGTTRASPSPTVDSGS